MKMTFQPKKRQRSKVHGFRSRMSTAGGRKVLAARRAKGRKKLSAQATSLWSFLLYIIKFRIKNLCQRLQKGHECQMKYSESLKKNRDFQNVYKKGKSFANRYLVMYVLENQTEQNRVGISVSKKVGNSVIRHHITRLIRESYRLHEDMFNSGLDIVVIARSTARDCKYREIESALLHLGGLHKITKS